MIKDKCFVIMPFGVKPVPDKPGKTFDFDKVYRTIIRRAVEEAGMEAIRADEQTGSQIIHSAMFRELRDRAVVLADLSLGNPNVYYELGIRHVLSPGGTLLICREKTELPFDIRLSRVIFYRYNGRDIDWEMVEEIVPRLKDALLTAKERKPDSPVHALLENVYPEEHQQVPGKKPNEKSKNLTTDNISNRVFEAMIAKHWMEKNENVDDLINKYQDNLFGMRALGEMSLLGQFDGKLVFNIAKNLYYLMQYDLSYRIIKHLEENNKGYSFTPDNYIKYGSVVSEREHSVKATDEGLRLMKKGLDIAVNEDVGGQKGEPWQIFDLYKSIGGLYRWKWQLTKSPEELNNAIDYMNKAAETLEEPESENLKPVGRIAQLFLQLLLLRRIQENSCDRPDREDYLGTILSMSDSEANHAREASYFRWYKIIAHADNGNENKVREGVINAVQKDRFLVHPDIGGSQYSMLRRFINNNLPFLRNHVLMGLISQDLQYASKQTRKD